jgi:hypothetical protein
MAGFESPDQLRKMLVDRVQTLRRRKQELLAKRDDELAKTQAQIDACQALADGWDSLSVQAALTLIPQTGIDLKVS